MLPIIPFLFYPKSVSDIIFFKFVFRGNKIISVNLFQGGFFLSDLTPIYTIKLLLEKNIYYLPNVKNPRRPSVAGKEFDDKIPDDISQLREKETAPLDEVNDFF